MLSKQHYYRLNTIYTNYALELSLLPPPSDVIAKLLPLLSPNSIAFFTAITLLSRHRHLFRVSFKALAALSIYVIALSLLNSPSPPLPSSLNLRNDENQMDVLIQGVKSNVYTVSKNSPSKLVSYPTR